MVDWELEKLIQTIEETNAFNIEEITYALNNLKEYVRTHSQMQYLLPKEWKIAQEYIQNTEDIIKAIM